MRQPVALSNGKLIPAAELSLPVSDLGFINGATITEQTRTFRGEIFELPRHLDRFWRGLELIEIAQHFDRLQLADQLRELVVQNRNLLDPADDFGLCFFATPGTNTAFDVTSFQRESAVAANQPTLTAHTYPLPFSRWADCYESGFALVRSSHLEVSAASWPKSIKSRSRLHYYLADLEAARISPGAKPILCDAGGNVRDSSIASIIACDARHGLITPVADVADADVADADELSQTSVSVQIVKNLANDLGISFSERQIPYSQLCELPELMLATTPWCLAPVSSIDGKKLPSSSGPVFRKLIAHWSQAVGVDIVEQAGRFSQRGK